MKTNYYFWILILLLLGINSCEKDDFCLQSITPKLTLRFYDFEDNTALKLSENMFVWATDKDSIYKSVALDSIYIPLILSDVKTSYVLENNSILDTLELTYTPHDVFVSRSCGYKTIFEDFQVSRVTNNWIKEIEIINTIIENDTAAHIRILH